MDYCFLGTRNAPGEGPQEMATVLVVKDRQSRAVCSTVVPVKGAMEEFVPKRVAAFSRNWVIRRSQSY